MSERAQLAEGYDAAATLWRRGAEVLAAITPALASRVGPITFGDTVLDVACGAGEPGLSLVEAVPGVRLVGVDIAPGMIEGARAEAAARAIADTHFEVGSAEALPLEDASVEAVVSRMGMLAFPGASPATAQEAFRVLRPGAPLAIAVWNRWEEQTAGAASAAACRAVGGQGADMSWLDELADGRREQWLSQAGFSSVMSEPISWAMRFADLSALWTMGTATPPLAGAYSALDDAARTAAREHLATSVAAYRQPNGSYAIPVTARLITAVKPPTT